jgi:hypothetical protein
MSWDRSTAAVVDLYRQLDGRAPTGRRR